MTIQITSNAPYTGQYLLTNAADIDPDYYKKRVLADGGIIINQTALDAAISWLHSLGLSILDCWAISASWGVKLASDGKTIIKVYSLDGNDFVPHGTTNIPQLDQNSFSFPVLRRTGGGGGQSGTGWLTSQAIATLCTGTAMTFAAMMYTESGDNIQIGCGPALQLGSTTAFSAPPLAIVAYNNDNAHSYQVGAIANAATSGVVQLISSDYADFRAQVLHVDYLTKIMKMLIGTGPTIYSTAAGTAGFYDFRTGRLNMFCLSYSNGTADYGLQTKGACREMWHVKKSTEAIASALATRMSSL